ncbi:MAG TPA: NmrA family NAD(P)-binding protein [Candidatus Acidoferrum sp.]|jgi:uncharacterized protein YbjT (DUF2867 family)
MYVVMGATGNTGSVVAARLLEKGEKVRAIGRDKYKLSQLERLGAESATADAYDAAALTSVFSGAKAAYILLPPRAKEPELLASGEKMSEAIAAAIQAAGVSHVVVLSSIGAQRSSKTGPIQALHVLEEKLLKVPNLNALFLRPGPFMENFLLLIPLVRSMGFLAGGIDADLKMPITATRDIGEAAADALLKLEFSGFSTRELQGQRDISHKEAAAAIGAAIGKPKLSYKQFPAFLVEQGMKQMGIPGKTATLMSEMNDAANDGRLSPLESRSAKNTTATSIVDWAKEVFLPAYRS